MCTAEAVSEGRANIAALSTVKLSTKPKLETTPTEIFFRAAIRELVRIARDPLAPAEVARYCRLAEAATGGKPICDPGPTNEQMILAASGLGYLETTWEATAGATC